MDNEALFEHLQSRYSGQQVKGGRLVLMDLDKRGGATGISYSHLHEERGDSHYGVAVVWYAEEKFHVELLEGTKPPPQASPTHTRTVETLDEVHEIIDGSLKDVPAG